MQVVKVCLCNLDHLTVTRTHGDDSNPLPKAPCKAVRSFSPHSSHTPTLYHTWHFEQVQMADIHAQLHQKITSSLAGVLKKARNKVGSRDVVGIHLQCPN